MSPAAIGATAVAAIGAALLAYSAAMHLRLRRHRAWDAVPGSVVRAWLEEVAVPGTEVMVPAWQPRVRYAYRWQGAQRTGSVLCPDPHAFRFTDRARALRQLAAWPAGAAVTVRVSPQGDAVLTPTVDRARRSHYQAVGLAGLLVLGAAATLLALVP